MDPPLTIPNREVKRNHADGTYTPVGRVGSRRSLTRALKSIDFGALLLKNSPRPPAAVRLPPRGHDRQRLRLCRAAPGRRIAPPFAAALKRPAIAAAACRLRRGNLFCSSSDGSLQKTGTLPSKKAENDGSL